MNVPHAPRFFTQIFAYYNNQGLTPDLAIVRKSIVAAKNIQKSESFTEENLTVKRPGTGVSPMRWDEVVGQVAQMDYKEDELI